MATYTAVGATGGHGIHLHERPGSGHELVLLHGIPGVAGDWAETASRLPTDYRLLMPDLLGFGASERTTALDRIHAVGQAEALEAVLAPLLRARPLLVGHDFGGPVALELLRRMPSRFSGLALIATNLLSDTPIPFPLSAVNVPLAGGIAARALFSPRSLRLMYRRGAARSTIDPRPGIGDAAQARAIATIFRSSLQNLRGLYGPIESLLPAIELPVLVIWGDNDPFFRTAQGARTAGRFQNARLVTFPDCGHFVPLEAPALLAGALETFIASTALEPTP